MVQWSSAARAILSGAAGFILGGLLWGLIPFLYSGQYLGILLWPVGGLIFGLSGGYFLGVLPNGRLRLAFYGAAGYLVSMLFIMAAIDQSVMGKGLLAGILMAFGVLAGGFLLGYPVNRLKLFGVLSTAGFILGGGLGLLMYQGVRYLIISGTIPFIEPLTSSGMVIGLGIGMGVMMGIGKYLVENNAGSQTL